MKERAKIMLTTMTETMLRKNNFIKFVETTSMYRYSTYVVRTRISHYYDISQIQLRNMKKEHSQLLKGLGKRWNRNKCYCKLPY